MAISPLATVRVPAYTGNYSKGRTKDIRCITIHHMAGVLTAAQCGAIFTVVGRNGSTHYGVGVDGSIGNYVDENDTAWGNSNWNSNCESISIETSNSAMGGDWPVAEVTFEALVNLVAEIAKRNNLGKLTVGANLTYHRMFTATTCPGPYLMSRLEEIAKRANIINGYEKPAPAPTPDPAKDPKDPSQWTDEELADLVIRGVYGNNPGRKEALGDRYAAVQAIVNKKCGVDPKPTPIVDEIKEGDRVVPIKLVSYEGIPLRQYDEYYNVMQLRGNRAVLTNGNGIVWASVHVDNLRKV